MSYQHITIDERDALQSMQAMKQPVREMAKTIGKHPSTIYRELARNSTHGNYISRKADEKATKRRKDNRTSPVTGNIELMNTVERLIKKQIAPDQIAGRIMLERGYQHGWTVSHETIFKYIYEQIHLGNDLRVHLRHPRKVRRKRSAGKDRRGIIPGRVFIDDRPPIVDRKFRRGDWEGDTIEGAGKKGYVATFVDRKTKYLIAYKLEHKSSMALVRGARKAFRSIPASMLKTITVDNGKEFAAHKKLAQTLGVKVFFAHPYHSWERGLNEHTNGLIRQYLPKGRSLLDLESRELAKIVKRINNRPRKSLGYRTPYEAFFKIPLALQI
ncbi:IS30 family transposase [Spirochaetota bacterium]